MLVGGCSTMPHMTHRRGECVGRSSRGSASVCSAVCVLMLICVSTQSNSALALGMPGSVPVLEGPLEDCCCRAEVIEEGNAAIFDALHRLTSKSRFFALFRSALYAECPYWQDDQQCMNEDCALEPSDESEIPREWLHAGSCAQDDEECLELEQRQRQNEQLERRKQQLNHAKGLHPALFDTSIEGPSEQWGARGVPDAAWTVLDPDDPERVQYIDLIKNPERFTGYAGDSARKVWHAIYTENCFHFARNCASGVCTDDACRAERVLFRLISGLHVSINAHVAMDFVVMDHGPRGRESANASSYESSFLSHPPWKVWGFPNVDIYRWRIGNFPERIRNLYFTMALMLRALGKARTELDPDRFLYTTGNAEQDQLTQRLVRELYELPLLAPNCAAPFDESSVFDVEHEFSSLMQGTSLRDEFRAAFRNISSIMDCVGCDTCRLWGKVQFLGVGTALKILFDKHDESHSVGLQRNEVIALFHTAAKLSDSIRWIQDMERLSREVDLAKQVRAMMFKCAAGVLVTLFAGFCLSTTRRVAAAKAKGKAVKAQ
ncbi:Endoplasmic reticulum oxidoreductin-2 [Porphyridium purpureum]|uniref:Endoplasmic reticulum oxidoreductin-2 n=1 Tax=Porphyridium purpureum TaxID=35688 RepID=A0A5J4ZA39_PORPP|nr:Endoplasmic reticulum oxidoreductin-2 [Porphyridium purpureum]|eukprot:POR9174..scf295_1